MSQKPDITVYAPDRGVLLVAEVKGGRNGTSPEWAAELRGELLPYLPIVGTAPYFMIASPNRLFLWRQDRPHGAGALPDYVADTKPFLDTIVDTERLPLSQVPRDTLESLVAIRLGALTHERRNGAPVQGWLADSGLLDALRGGSVQLGAAHS